MGAERFVHEAGRGVSEHVRPPGQIERAAALDSERSFPGGGTYVGILFLALSASLFGNRSALKISIVRRVWW